MSPLASPARMKYVVGMSADYPPQIDFKPQINTEAHGTTNSKFEARNPKDRIKPPINTDARGINPIIKAVSEFIRVHQWLP
jgi:hypothetical protein